LSFGCGSFDTERDFSLFSSWVNTSFEQNQLLQAPLPKVLPFLPNIVTPLLIGCICSLLCLRFSTPPLGFGEGVLFFLSDFSEPAYVDELRSFFHFADPLWCGWYLSPRGFWMMGLFLVLNVCVPLFGTFVFSDPQGFPPSFVYLGNPFFWDFLFGPFLFLLEH